MSKKLLKQSVEQWKAYIKQIKFIKSLQKKALVRGFRVWKNISKRNWKLEIRAQVYAKLKILKGNFLKFTFAHQNLVKEKRFLKTRTLRKWQGLRLYNQNLKLDLQTKLLKAYFHTFQRAFQESRKISCQIQKSKFKKWNLEYCTHLCRKSNLFYALKKYQISLLSTRFIRWNNKYTHQIQKNLKIQIMMELTKEKILNKFLSIWKIQKTFKEFKRNLVELAEWTNEKNTKNRLWKLWRLQYSSALKEKEILQIVQTLKTRKIMQEFVLGLKKQVLTQKYVVLSREVYTLKHYFIQIKQKWINRVGQREQEECRLGILYSNTKLKEKNYKKWIKRTFALKEKRIWQDVALNFSQRSNLKKLFTLWKQEWKKAKIESRMILKAQRYSRKKSLEYYMDLWGNIWNRKLELSKKMEQALEFYGYKLKQKGLSGFKENLFKSLENNYFMVFLCHFENRSLLQLIIIEF